MKPDRPFTQAEDASDFPIGFSFLHPEQDGEFPRRQGGRLLVLAQADRLCRPHLDVRLHLLLLERLSEEVPVFRTFNGKRGRSRHAARDQRE